MYHGGAYIGTIHHPWIKKERYLRQGQGYYSLYQAWPLEDCLNEAVVQDMKRVRPEDHDSVYGQNRQSFRPPPVLAPAPVGMATYSEQLQQDGLSGLAQFPAAAQMAGAPGYQ